MTTSRLFTYLMLFMVGGLLSCSDHPIQSLVTPGSTANRLRVKTLTEDLPNNQTKVSLFRYDVQGRLSQILAYQTPDSTVSAIEYSNYTYDQQNRLTGLRREAVQYPRPRDNQQNRVEQYIYTYNPAGQLTEINYVNGFRVGFSYNSSGQLVSSNRSFSDPIANISLSGSNSFIFTGNNLSTLNSNSFASLRGPVFSSESVTTYTHDHKVNPFYSVLVIPAPSKGFINLMTGGPAFPVETYFGGVDNVLNLSRNNILSEVTNSTSTQNFINPTSSTLSTIYQYQYNAANLPTVRTKTTTPALNSTVTVETLRFEYESY
ncbi:MAG: hypothetical protein JWP57_318 [Spirosoma sp.]|nr:hypothetical protein [Spirosoma sp.]